MLAPNLYKWYPPPISKSYKEGQIFEDYSFLEKNILNHYFNFSVSLLIPDALSVPANLKEEFLNDSTYYRLSSVSLYKFISQDFIDFFIKCGEVTMLSINTKLDLDDCVAVTPCGHLVLSLNKLTFQKLGIVQGPSIRVHKKEEKFFVTINLLGDSFSIGKKNYDNLYNSIKESKVTFDVIITWEPKEDQICPSSVAFFLNKIGVEVSECSIKETTGTNYNIKFPSLKTPNNELFEWFGVLLLGLRPPDDDPVEEYVSSLKEPENSEDLSRVAQTTFAGLITRRKILRVMNLLRDISKNCDINHWVGIHVQGFEDAVTSWALTPHHFHTCGDNSYSTILAPSGEYRFCKIFTKKI